MHLTIKRLVVSDKGTASRKRHAKILHLETFVKQNATQPATFCFQSQTCDSKHLIAEAATLFDFWIASETELSAQSHLLVDAQALTRLRTGF
jgi:hypothetical protein